MISAILILCGAAIKRRPSRGNVEWTRVGGNKPVA